MGSDAENSREVPSRMGDRLIVALDVPDCGAASRIVERLDGIVSFYKIGLHLLFRPGSDALVDDLVSVGLRVFLDYKMYDIAETVRAGMSSVADRGVTFATVHGDAAIMRAAVEGRGASAMKVFAVTVLTGMDDASVAGMGHGDGVAALVAARAAEAAACGCDGIIASPADGPSRLRLASGNPRLLVATPGIRLHGDPEDDHRRLATPSAAIRGGADYLVVGRPIVGHPDPGARALAVIADMAAGASGFPATGGTALPRERR